jgi:hypothetical protein
MAADGRLLDGAESWLLRPAISIMQLMILNWKLGVHPIG